MSIQFLIIMFTEKFLKYFLLCFFLHWTNSCSNDGYPYENYLSTKTPYRLVSNNSFERISYEGKSSGYLKTAMSSIFLLWLWFVLGCEPKKVWMLIRHGTRNPSDTHITHMKRRLPEIRRLILNSKELPNGKIFKLINLINSLRFWVAVQFEICCILHFFKLLFYPRKFTFYIFLSP